jgi:hypothetical protein
MDKIEETAAIIAADSTRSGEGEDQPRYGDY